MKQVSKLHKISNTVIVFLTLGILAGSGGFIARLKWQIESNRALVIAIDVKDYAKAKQLLSTGADPNCVSRKKRQLLTDWLQKHLCPDSAHYFSIEYHLPLLVEATQDSRLEDGIVGDLVKFGADINCTDKGQESSLYRAVGNQDLNIARFLIKAGANVNESTTDGATILTEACIYSQDQGVPSIVVELIRNGANVNATDCHGNTALMGAAERRTDIVRYLLNHGADASLKNDHGASALDFAEHSGNERSVNLIDKCL